MSRRRSDDLLDLVDAEYFHDDVRSRKMGGLDSGDRDMRRCYDESQALEVLAVDMGWVHGEKFCVTSPPKFYDKECYFQDFGFGPYLKKVAEPVLWWSIIEDPPEAQKDTGDVLSPAFFVNKPESSDDMKEKSVAVTIAIPRPVWMKEEGRNFFHRYSQFDNQFGGGWAFLFDIENDTVFLSGGDINWAIKTMPGSGLTDMDHDDAMGQITTAHLRFMTAMHLEERMWLAACLRVAAAARANYLSGRK